MSKANQFEVGGSTDLDDADISIVCRLCTFNEWLTVSTDEDGPGVPLSELNRLAQDHLASGCIR